MTETPSSRMHKLRERTRSFVAEQIIPFEKDQRLTPHGPEGSPRTELVGLARKAGLYGARGVLMN